MSGHPLLYPVPCGRDTVGKADAVAAGQTGHRWQTVRLYDFCHCCAPLGQSGHSRRGPQAVGHPGENLLHQALWEEISGSASNQRGYWALMVD